MNILKDARQSRKFRNNLRASFKTGVTRRTEPDKLAGENFLFHPEKCHPDDFFRVISMGDLPYRASCCTGAAGEAFLYVLSPWL
jgi:hypothetical protein